MHNNMSRLKQTLQCFLYICYKKVIYVAIDRRGIFSSFCSVFVFWFISGYFIFLYPS